MSHAGPLSEMGELRETVEDVHSVYAEGDSDLISSDGGEQAWPLAFNARCSGHTSVHVACLGWWYL